MAGLETPIMSCLWHGLIGVNPDNSTVKEKISGYESIGFFKYTKGLYTVSITGIDIINCVVIATSNSVSYSVSTFKKEEFYFIHIINNSGIEVDGVCILTLLSPIS